MDSKYQVIIKLIELFASSSENPEQLLDQAIQVLKLKKNLADYNLAPIKEKLHPSLVKLENQFLNQYEIQLKETNRFLGAMTCIYVELYETPTKENIVDMMTQFSQSKNKKLDRLGSVGNQAILEVYRLIEWVAQPVLNGQKHDPLPIFLTENGEQRVYHTEQSCQYWQAFTHRLERNTLKEARVIFDPQKIPPNFRLCSSCNKPSASSESELRS